jgi:predicted phosphodiesterase
VYCLGDLVGYNIWPNEVINGIRKRNIPTIAGNYDQGIGLMSDDCGCAYKTDLEKDMGKISISFTNSLVKSEERKYLRTLPAHIKVEFQLNKDKLNLLLVHGSPRKINEYLFEDRDEKSLLRIMENADADILCFGHTHKPFHRILNSVNPSYADAAKATEDKFAKATGEESAETLEGDPPSLKLRRINQNHFRHAINIGSVGKPKDENPMGCYVILTINDNSSITYKDSIGVEFIRFSYDIEKAAKAILDSPLPDAYAEMLRSGK